jgi:hypothetical protein
VAEMGQLIRDRLNELQPAGRRSSSS